MRSMLICGLLSIASLNLAAQNNYKQDSIKIRRIFDQALVQGKTCPWLRHLSKNIGHRLAGSEGDKKAVAWGKKELENLGLDSVWLQPVKVPHWVRGAKEEAHIKTQHGEFQVPILAFLVWRRFLMCLLHPAGFELVKSAWFKP